MAAGTDVGDTTKPWERLLALGLTAAIDGYKPTATVNPAPQETAPEQTINDTEPYLLRVAKNPLSQNILIGTVVIVGALGLLYIVRK